MPSTVIIHSAGTQTHFKLFIIIFYLQDFVLLSRSCVLYSDCLEDSLASRLECPTCRIPVVRCDMKSQRDIVRKKFHCSSLYFLIVHCIFRHSRWIAFVLLFDAYVPRRVTCQLLIYLQT